jgi:hypothetical protein
VTMAPLPGFSSGRSAGPSPDPHLATNPPGSGEISSHWTPMLHPSASPQSASLMSIRRIAYPVQILQYLCLNLRSSSPSRCYYVTLH